MVNLLHKKISNKEKIWVWSTEIVGMDVKELLDLLNKAFADEWFAYYQYWLGAKVVRGPMKDAVAAELLQHATEELLHADMVANRIIQLGGRPLTEPKKWYRMVRLRLWTAGR